MTPVRVAGLGYVLVLFRVPFGWFEYALHALGWVLVALGYGEVAGHHRWLRAAHLVGWVMTGLSVLLAATGWSDDWWLGAYNTGLALAVTTGSFGIAGLAHLAADRSVRWQGTAIGWVTVVQLALVNLGYLLDATGFDAGPMVTGWLVAGFLAVVWFTLLQIFAGDRAYLLPVTGTPGRG